MSDKATAETTARITFLQQAFASAPTTYQPVTPRRLPNEVPFTPGQMITWQHLQDGVLPIPVALDSESFPVLGCPLDCTGCSVPVHIRHASEVVMRPAFWARVFEIINTSTVQMYNPDLPQGAEPEHAPYMRILGGEPSTYRPKGYEDGQAVAYGTIIDLLRAARQQPYFMAGLFSDGVSILRQPEIQEQLVDVLERIHSSVDYLPLDELPRMGWDEYSDREKKASYGGHMLAYFAQRGIDSVANIVLIPPHPERGEPGNLDQVIDLSRWLWDRGITTTYCPIISRRHKAQHGREEQAYVTELRRVHTPALREMVAALVAEQLAGRGKIRNSRAYLEGIPYAGVDQLVGWHGERGTTSFSPNGRMGVDPMFKTEAELADAPGGYYGYEDHYGKWEALRGDAYIALLERERAKWAEIVRSGRAVHTRVDPPALLATIEEAITFWEAHPEWLAPTNSPMPGQNDWWGNTIKNTKVGRYRGIYRADSVASQPVSQPTRSGAA